jgi:hypothetical protein
MRKVIDGKVYNTETATVVCDISPSGFYSGDFRYENTYLYKSPKGTFFISGTGGPLSRWAVPEGNNGHRGGSGLYVIDDDEARGFCERHGSASEFEAAFGEPEEG